MSQPLFADDLQEVVVRAQEIAEVDGARRTVAVVFFDLVGSTARKLDEGHKAGTRAAIVHNEICRALTEQFLGTVVKELGDGVLAAFDDPVQACLAALNARGGVDRTGFATRVGLTLGVVDVVETRFGDDLLGATVDRASRLCSLALPRQVILDESLLNAVASVLRDYAEIEISEGVAADLKGIGPVSVAELTDAQTGFVGTTSHLGAFEDTAISPIDVRRYPVATDPARWLVCDVCGEPVATDGSDANIVFDEERDRAIRSVRIVHRHTCDDKLGSWRQLSELANPLQYVNFVTSLLNRLANRQMIVEDSEGLAKVLVGMYRNVFRPSSQTEELDYASDAALREMGI